MREQYDELDDKSRDAAKKIRIAVDYDAWVKMKLLLDEENKGSITHIISNKLKAGENNIEKRKWLYLVLLFLFTIGSVLFIANNNTLKSKLLSLVSKDGKASDKNFPKNVTSNNVVAEQPLITDLLHQQPGKNGTDNKNTLMPVTGNSTHTKDLATGHIERQQSTKNNLLDVQQNEDNEKVTVNVLQSEPGSFDNDELKKIGNQPTNNGNRPLERMKDSNPQEIEVLPGINKKDTTAIAVNKKSAVPSKNKFFKNIGFTVLACIEVNTVNFKKSDMVTGGYGAGISYTIGKHFTAGVQFINSRKVYATDKKGYSPPAGSSLIAFDTLEVNADCSVWDIPVNLRYSFSGNIKNSFFISAGISSYIMKKEIYNFAYYDQGEYKTKQRIIDDENKHSFCNLNLTAGFQYWLNKKWSVGFEPYLKLPLDGIGAGKVELTSAGVLFNLTFKPMQ